MTTPKVSIGMPVYNGEPFIREALDSLLAQTFTDFDLIISDNASTDGTEAICQEYAAKDKRIRYIRQTENRGATANFQFVLDEAVGEYFMWAAADDRWGELFVEENFNFLTQNFSYIGSISQSYTQSGEIGAVAGSTTISNPDKWDRVEKFLVNPASNARYYSLWRRSHLANLKLSRYDYVAGDWAIISELLKSGMINCIGKEIQFFKGAGISANPVRYFDSVRKNFLEFLFPFFFFSQYLLSSGFFVRKPYFTIKMIFLWNYGGFVPYWRQRLGTILWRVVKLSDVAAYVDHNVSDLAKSKQALKIYLNKWKNRFKIANRNALR